MQINLLIECMYVPVIYHYHQQYIAILINILILPTVWCHLIQNLSVLYVVLLTMHLGATDALTTSSFHSSLLSVT